MVFGVVYFVGFVVDYWVDMREIVELWKVERIFELKMDEKIRERFYKGWKEVVKRVMGWVKVVDSVKLN